MSARHLVLVVPSAVLQACAALPSSAPAPQFYSRSTSTLTLIAGQRSFDTDYSPVDDQPTLGLELEVHQQEGAAGFEVAFLASQDSGMLAPAGLPSTEFEGSSWEFSVGGRWRFDPVIGLEPYAGIGVAVFGVSFESKTPGGESDDDIGYGIYAHAGVDRALGSDWRVGLDLRGLSISEVKLFGVDTEADYLQLALTVGYSF